MRTWIVCAAVLTGAGAPAAPLLAQEGEGFDTTVVVAGGQWKNGTHSGTYRVTVHTQGTEHVASSIRIEWVRAEGGRVIVVASRDSVPYLPDRMYSLETPRFDVTSEGSRISFCGSHAYIERNTCWKVILGPPGTILRSEPHD